MYTRENEILNQSKAAKGVCCYLFFINRQQQLSLRHFLPFLLNKMFLQLRFSKLECTTILSLPAAQINNKLQNIQAFPPHYCLLVFHSVLVMVFRPIIRELLTLSSPPPKDAWLSHLKPSDQKSHQVITLRVLLGHYSGLTVIHSWPAEDKD